MPVFKSKEMMEEMFGEIWTKMVKETEFGSKLKEGGITIYFVVNDPDVVMFVDENGPLFGDEAKAKIPVVTMKMSADNVHKFWLNKLNLPKALALRHIKAKGPVGKDSAFVWVRSVRESRLPAGSSVHCAMAVPDANTPKTSNRL